MANPQKENGYTAIANELLEAFIAHKFTEYERVIILHIWRKTYGWNKKSDFIANSQFVEDTGIPKGRVSETLKNLKNRKVVTCTGNNKLSINKNWEEWVVTCRGNSCYLYSKQSVTCTGSTKEKKTNTKDIYTFSLEKVNAIKNNKNTKTMKKNKIGKYNEKNSVDAYEDVIDLDTGEMVIEKQPKKKEASKQIKDYFVAKIAQKFKEKIFLGKQADLQIFRLFNVRKMKPSEICDVIDWWIDKEEDPAKAIKFSWCISDNNINDYKIQQKLK